jgi:hypothetical protein
MVLTTLLALGGLTACTPVTAPPAEDSWWPGPEILSEPAELLEIPSLEDDEFLAEVRRTAAEAASVPTNRENYVERATLARRFFNALEAGGVVIPRVALLGMNLVEARAADPDPLFASYAGAVDVILQGGLRMLEERGRLGEVVVVRPSDMRLVARRYTTIELVWRVGAMPVGPGTKIRFSGDWHDDSAPLQFSRPHAPGYVTVRCSNPDVRLATGMEYWNAVWGSLYPPGLARPVVTVVEGTLAEGDTLTLVLGDTSGGGPGYLVRSTAIDVQPIRVELSLTGGQYEYVPIGEPHFRVRGGAAHHLRLVIPTTVRRDRPFVVRASVEDLYANRAIDPPATLILRHGEVELARVGHVPDDPAVFHFEGITWPEGHEGPLVLRVENEGETLFGTSNPAVVVADDQPLLYWGQLHGHEGYTDGSGTAEWWMRYARDVGFLDFASLSAHDIMISELLLRDVLRATAKYHQDNRFVTLKGYEWTQDTRFGGHHNVYYRSTEQRNIPAYEAPTISDLYRIQREVNGAENVLIIPHCHQPGDWNFNDAAMERLVEIYSTHGSFEWFGRRYLEMGFHVGLTTGADDHTGHPGNNMGLAANRFGQSAVFASELTRDGIFDGLVARRCYGTSVARIYLDTRTEGAPMGSELELPRPSPASIRVDGVVAGTAPIARVVAVVNGRDSHMLDYLQEGDSDRVFLRVMIGSSSEPTDGSRVLPPLSSEYRLGRIAVVGARVVGVTPLGLEGPGDSFVQSGDGRVDFFCTTRGDEDGVLLELDAWPENGQVLFEAFAAPDIDPSVRGRVTIPNPMWGEERLLPERDLIARLRIPAPEMGTAPQTRQFGEHSYVRVERVRGDLEAYREFAFDITDNLRDSGENYVYVRVEQIDDERAWSSPVWVTWNE